jgi:hypothetical protein
LRSLQSRGSLFKRTSPPKNGSDDSQINGSNSAARKNQRPKAILGESTATRRIKHPALTKPRAAQVKPREQISTPSRQTKRKRSEKEVSVSSFDPDLDLDLGLVTEDLIDF